VIESSLEQLLAGVVSKMREAGEHAQADIVDQATGLMAQVIDNPVNAYHALLILQGNATIIMRAIDECRPALTD
jgi:hypothetical protein